MDKFMIDPKEPKINNSVSETEEDKYKEDDKQNEYKEDTQHEYKNDEYIEDTKEAYENVIITPKEQVLSSYTYITIAIGLLVFVSYVIYYSFKYKDNEKQYLIKSNASTFKTTLDDLQSDIKIYLKTKTEQFLNWKEKMQQAIDKYFFKKHIDNGVFKVKKYKATNLLPTHKSE
jgi:Fe-S cluster assembly scaffold protein SufB